MVEVELRITNCRLGVIESCLRGELFGCPLFNFLSAESPGLHERLRPGQFRVGHGNASLWLPQPGLGRGKV